MSVIVTGKNSFLGQALQAHDKTKDWIFFSHDEAPIIEHGDILINCAYHPDLTRESYNSSKDFDLRLGNAFADRVGLYVMISSRTVYPNALHMDEERKLAPQSFYGAAKAETEQRLRSLLPPEKLLIFRCANLFGDEYGRTSFTGLSVTRLKDEGRIVFGLSPETRKDFLPVEIFCDRLVRAVSQKLSGLYNMGSGIALPCGKAAQALIDGYGSGHLEVEDETLRGEFSLDMSRLNEKLGLSDLAEQDILNAFETVGQNLQIK